MQGITVCVPVAKPDRLLKPVGGVPLGKRIAEQITAIRGVTGVVCVSKQRNADAAAAAKLFVGAQSMSVDPSLSPQKLAAMCGARAGGLCLVVSPTLAFLSAGKMEQCLREAKKHGAAAPGRAVKVRGAKGSGTVHETLVACEAFKLGHTGKFVTVPVSLFESLDAADDDEYSLITAAVTTHKL